MKTFEEILKFSKKINQDFFSTGKIDFQELTDFSLDLAEGKFAAFNLFIENTANFKTLGLSGEKGILKKAFNFLGYSPKGKVWEYDPIREEKINKSTVTVFNDLTELTGKVIPKNIVTVIEKIAGIQQVVVIRVEINKKTAADFTIFMDKNQQFKNFEEADLFASQASILIDKLNISRNLIEKIEYFDFLVEATGAGTWDWDMISDKVVFSREWKAMLGYSDEEVENSFNGWKNLWHPEDVPMIEKTIKDYMEEKIPKYEVVHRLKHKKGGWKWILTRGNLLKDEKGKPYRWAGINIDLTELKENEEKQKVLVDNSYDIIYRITTDGKFDFISQAWTTLLGHTVEDALGKSFEPYVHPEDLKKLTDFFDKIKKTKQRIEVSDYRLKHKDGSWHIFTTNAVPIWDENGKITGYAGTARDITDLKLALEQALEQKEELERFFTVNLDLLCITDLQGNFIRINKSWERILGYPVEYILKTNFLTYVHPDDLESTLEAVGNLKDGNPVLNFTNRYRAWDGNYKHIEWRSVPYNNLIYAAARDVTENINISRELRMEKELFQTTLLSVGDGVVSTDSSGYIILMNQVAQNLTGWTQEEAKNTHLSKVFPIIREDNREPANVEIKNAFDSGEILEIQDVLLISKTGKEIPIEKTSAPVRDGEGNITGVVTVFRDFTDRKEKQKEVEYLSYHDQLTGLYNRRFMEDSLKRLDTERNLPLCIMMMDVNGLKMANDAFGHKMGDRLLIASAEILLKVTRADDILCRVGGDEFMLILPQTDCDSANRIKKRIAEKAKAMLLDSVVVSLAVGFEIKTSAFQDINDILRQADSNMYKDKFKFGRSMRLQTINNIIKDIDKKYYLEKEHREKVAEYSLLIGRALEFDENRMEELKLAASVHDVGKIKISEELLNKEGKPSKEEWEELKKHPVTGYKILKAVDDYAGIAEEVLHHHERWDGKGYPKRLKGEEIPLISRIISVADAFQAMTSERPYKSKKTFKEAATELKQCSGTQFAPEIVKIFVELLEKEVINENEI